MAILSIFVLAAILAPKPPLRLPASAGRLRRCCAALMAAPPAARHALFGCVSYAWNHPLVVRLGNASSSITLPVKLKLLLGFALVVAQIEDVYQIRYPDGYHTLTHRIFTPLRLQLFGWIPGLHLRCLGISTLQSELLLYSLMPMGIAFVLIAVSWTRWRTVFPALPWVLRLTYFFYPSVASKGFQTLGTCDCFLQIDGSQLCLLLCEMFGGL